MIDYETIKKVADNFSKDANVRDAFKDGIDWFTNSLWHLTSTEEPKPNVPLLCQAYDHPQKYFVSIYSKQVKLLAFRWCYIDDLNFNDCISSDTADSISTEADSSLIDPTCTLNAKENFRIAKEIFLNYFKNEQDLRGIEEPIEAFSERIADNACKAAQTFLSLYNNKYGEHEKIQPSYYALQQP